VYNKLDSCPGKGAVNHKLLFNSPGAINLKNENQFGIIRRLQKCK